MAAQTPPATPATLVETKEHIRRLSIQLVEAMNSRTWTETAKKLLIPTFSGYHDMDDNSWSVNTRDAIIKQMEEFLVENPDFHTDIHDMSVDVDEQRGTASVWMLRTDMNLAEGPRRETVMELAWARKGNEWFCSGYQGVRSFPFYASDEAFGGGGL